MRKLGAQAGVEGGENGALGCHSLEVKVEKCAVSRIRKPTSCVGAHGDGAQLSCWTAYGKLTCTEGRQGKLDTLDSATTARPMRKAENYALLGVCRWHVPWLL